MRYFILNKPPGCISARRDWRDRPTIYGHIPPHYPALPHVGRLDFHSEGLLLFTDDGKLSQVLLNANDPRRIGPDGEHREVAKRYEVKVRNLEGPEDPRLEAMQRPLEMPSGTLTRPARVRYLRPRTRSDWIEVVITEGRNRQVRRLCAREYLQVVKLRRVALGPLELGDLRVRWCRPLSEAEVAECYALAMPGEPQPPFEAIIDTPEAYAAAKSGGA